jgi:membrane fusion protein (multidrug efflux system)
VIRRPAGEVVYVIRDGRAEQRVVDTGERLDGLVEIIAGVAAGETVAVEGAAYLSDDAPVRLAGNAP